MAGRNDEDVDQYQLKQRPYHRLGPMNYPLPLLGQRKQWNVVCRVILVGGVLSCSLKLNMILQSVLCLQHALDSTRQVR